MMEEEERTLAERTPLSEHIDDEDLRYAGFRIREYWILTSVDDLDMESALFVTLPNALHFHLSQGPAMAADERRLAHLVEFAEWLAKENPGVELRIRHFVPEGEDRIIKA